MLAQEAIKESMLDFSDAQLAQHTLAGDSEAFEVLVQRYQTPIFGFVRHFLGDYDQACDITQQVFVRLYSSLPTLRKGVPFKAWLFQVARYCCIDEVRRQHRQAIPFSHVDSDYQDEDTFAINDIPDPHCSLEEEQEKRDIQCTLRQAIAELPPKFCAVVTLRYAGQLKFSEIGRTLHMPEPTAKTYFARARLLLQKRLVGEKEFLLSN